MKNLKKILFLILLSSVVNIHLLAQIPNQLIAENFIKATISDNYHYDIAVEDVKNSIGQLSQNFLNDSLTEANLENQIVAVLNTLFNNSRHTVKISRSKYEEEVTKLLNGIISYKSNLVDQSKSTPFNNEVESSLNKEEKLRETTTDSEIETIKAELELLKEQNRREEEKEKQKATDEEKKKEAEIEIKNNIGYYTFNYVSENARAILNKAYPLALNKLKTTNVEFISISKSNDMYNITVRLNYLNILRRPHYLDLGFRYDLEGEFDSWKFVNHSDIIAPRELTFGKLLHLD